MRSEGSYQTNNGKHHPDELVEKIRELSDRFLNGEALPTEWQKSHTKPDHEK